MTMSTPDALWASRSVRLLRPAAVICRGVTRDEAGRSLLAGLDLTVPVGARLLLVSDPPESGSLLLRILAGLVRPRGGRILIAGVDRDDESAAGWARRIAYVGPRALPNPWLSPAEALDLAARLAGMTGGERQRRVEEAAERFGLAATLDRPIRRGGAALAQRVAMAAALLGDPEVLLLDEPLAALAPDQRLRLLRLPGPRRTVILASRYPAREEGLVDRVALLRGGRLALHTAIRRLGELGFPLTRSGLDALAARGRGGRGGIAEAGEPRAMHTATLPATGTGSPR